MVFQRPIFSEHQMANWNMMCIQAKHIDEAQKYAAHRFAHTHATPLHPQIVAAHNRSPMLQRQRDHRDQ